MKRVILLLALLALVSGCQRDTDEKLAEFSGHIFVFNYRLSKANYVVTLNPLRPLPEGGLAIATYDNPHGGDALVTRQPLYAKMNKIVLESPDVQCVRQGQSYTVKVQLQDAAGKVQQRLETKVLATLDQSILPANPLIIGPAYDMNPQVFKPDDKVDMAPAQDCPV